MRSSIRQVPPGPETTVRMSHILCPRPVTQLGLLSLIIAFVLLSLLHMVNQSDFCRAEDRGFADDDPHNTTLLSRSTLIAQGIEFPTGPHGISAPKP